MSGRTRSTALLAAMFAVLVPGVAAQRLCEAGRCVTVTPGERYSAGGLHRLFFGSRHRELWTTPVHVDVLDLSTFAGGLTPLRRGGFGQTRVLHFRGADGHRYVFRSVDKDPSLGLPEELEGTFVDGIAQDQISGLHPYAALVVAPLLEAAGVLHAEPRLAVMPDEPRLGEFQDEFGGMFGMIEERPEEGPEGTPGFAGARDVVGTNGLFELLEEGPENQVDARAFLTARLLDVYLGDRDRHSDQWRWARVDDGDQHWWLPIPRDRDQAFVGLDGLVLSVTRIYRPRFVSFDKHYPNLFGATYNGRGLDRRLLSGLEQGVWDSAAVALHARLTNAVIDDAVRRLPLEAYAVGGAWLGEALKRRRDGLREMAREYYALLADRPDVHATDRDEYAQVRRLSDGAVEVVIYRNRTGRDAPYFRRTFRRDETKEIRLLMHGGDDRVVVSGDADGSILVRVVGGGGNDELIDSSVVGGRPTLFYDERGDNRIEPGRSARIKRRRPPESDLWERFPPPPPPDPLVRQPQNWGGFRVPQLWLSGSSDLGLLIGGGVIYYKYGFRHSPYKYRMDFRAAYATGATTGRAEYTVSFPKLVGRLAGAFHVRGSGIEIIKFYGLGNGTTDDPPAGQSRGEFFEVDQQELRVEPMLAVAIGPSVHLVGGPFFKLVHTESNEGTQLAATLPSETSVTLKHLGARVGLWIDTRDAPLAASRGVLLRVDATYNSGAFSGLDKFGSIRGEAATYLTPGRSPALPTLAFRVAGTKVWGNFPFYEAAFLGGAQSLRGFAENRFAGDAAVTGNAELRVPLGRHRILVPGRIGIFALGDAGRVFFEGDTTDKLHTAVGGGLWLSFLSRSNTVSIAVARSTERVGVYGRAGFLF